MHTLYVRWVHRTQYDPSTMDTHKGGTSQPPPFHCDHFTMVTTPTTPLVEGQQVKILIVSPKAYHTPPLHPLNPKNELDAYDLYDPCIEGNITQSRRGSEASITFVVANQRCETPVREACIWMEGWTKENLPHMGKTGE